MINISNEKVPIIVISHSLPLTDSRLREDNE